MSSCPTPVSCTITKTQRAAYASTHTPTMIDAAIRRTNRIACPKGMGGLSLYKPGAPATGKKNPSLALRACMLVAAIPSGYHWQRSLRRQFADVLRDAHRAELRPAHRAELGRLEHLLRQR